MSSDGMIPIENNLIFGGRIHHKRAHAVMKEVRGSGTALPRLMQNLKLFDGSVVKGGSSTQAKPNFARKPIKFII